MDGRVGMEGNMSGRVSSAINSLSSSPQVAEFPLKSNLITSLIIFSHG